MGSERPGAAARARACISACLTLSFGWDSPNDGIASNREPRDRPKADARKPPTWRTISYGQIAGRASARVMLDSAREWTRPRTRGVLVMPDGVVIATSIGPNYEEVVRPIWEPLGRDP